MKEAGLVIKKDIGRYIRGPEISWQPADLFPLFSEKSWIEDNREIRLEASRLPNELLIVVIANMITEEALPTYSSWLSSLPGPDRPGEESNVWGDWNRSWSAEENRHGDVLNRWLFLSGRVNLKEVESTIHHLIQDGGDTGTLNDPYRTFIYTSFQETATRISHLRSGQLAKKYGASFLQNICTRIAGDEQRHAMAYRFFVSSLMALDPSEMILAFADMMKKKITMPAMFMREANREKGSAFRQFEPIATRLGIYTAEDYIVILENLILDWKIENLTGLTSAATEAQEYLYKLPARLRRTMDRYQVKLASMPLNTSFGWINPVEPFSSNFQSLPN